MWVRKRCVGLVLLAVIYSARANGHGDFYRRVLEMPSSQRTPKNLEKAYSETRQRDFVEAANKTAERVAALPQGTPHPTRVKPKSAVPTSGPGKRRKSKNSKSNPGVKPSAPNSSPRPSAETPLGERSMQLDGVVVPDEIIFPGGPAEKTKPKKELRK